MSAHSLAQGRCAPWRNSHEQVSKRESTHLLGTEGWTESREQRAESREQRAESREKFQEGKLGLSLCVHVVVFGSTCCLLCSIFSHVYKIYNIFFYRGIIEHVTWSEPFLDSKQSLYRFRPVRTTSLSLSLSLSTHHTCHTTCITHTHYYIY